GFSVLGVITSPPGRLRSPARSSRAPGFGDDARACASGPALRTTDRPGGPPPQTAGRDQTPDSGVSDRFGRIPFRDAAADFIVFIRRARALHFTSHPLPEPAETGDFVCSLRSPASGGSTGARE